jgi:RNA-directed DNA polymerase
MKRYKNLWPEITSFNNLCVAARQAQRGKRFRPNVLEFNHQLESNLLQIQTDLIDRTYTPGPYHTFGIVDPKPRWISAAPYGDRVVHHALCNVIGPLLDRTLIAHTYANREGYGTHKALRRFVGYMRSSDYLLQCDIRKYFPTIDHKILKSLLRQKIGCADTVWLIEKIIDGSNPQEPIEQWFPGDDLLTGLRRKGLPIGNLTSQFFANLYLNGLDHFIKEELKIKKYLRYVDDFALFSNDRQELVEVKIAIISYLETLRLKLHPVKSQLFRTTVGASFVGFRMQPMNAAMPRDINIRVRSSNLHRARKRLRVQTGDERSLTSWFAHLDHGDTWGLKRSIAQNPHPVQSPPELGDLGG